MPLTKDSRRASAATSTVQSNNRSRRLCPFNVRLPAALDVPASQGLFFGHCNLACTKGQVWISEDGLDVHAETRINRS
jgi:hypothetical protein